ncbi:MAG: amidase [Nocardioidaceae bacterium]|nr:amidase [Nocardioidaceae bacterium]
MSRSSTGSRGVLDDLEHVRSGRIEAVDVVSAAQQRVARADSEVRAWVTMSPSARSAARTLDISTETAPLRGAVIGVKDIIDVSGLPTRCGSPRTTSPEPAGTSAACVRRLESLGAVVLGKTATTEYGYFAPAPTHNPAALGHTPGGSSSGSAAAVAAEMVPLALGTQTAGSTTRPASYCGVAGMVLAHGTIDMSGITGLSPSLDSLGMLARRVDDLAHVHRLLTRTSNSFDRTQPVPVHVWQARGLDIHRVMSAAIGTAAARLSDHGHPVHDLDWDDHVFTLLRDHPVVMSREAAHTRGSLLEQGAAISTQLQQLLHEGRSITDAAYEAALVRCSTSRTRIEQFLDRDGGVIIGPAAMGPPPPQVEGTGSPDLSRPWQGMGLPVLTIPGMRTAHGLPLGIQVIGVPGREAQMFEVARTLEELLSDVTVDAVGNEGKE